MSTRNEIAAETLESLGWTWDKDRGRWVEDETAKATLSGMASVLAVEVSRLRNVIQLACINGMAGLAEGWAKYFPDHPITIRADPRWLPIESAPDGTEIIVARITDNRLMWAESGRRGKGALCSLFYSLQGHCIPSPTHYAALPPVLKAQQKGGV